MTEVGHHSQVQVANIQLDLDTFIVPSNSAELTVDKKMKITPLFFSPKKKCKTDLNSFFGSSCQNLLPAGQSYM